VAAAAQNALETATAAALEAELLNQAATQTAAAAVSPSARSKTAPSATPAAEQSTAEPTHTLTPEPLASATSAAELEPSPTQAPASTAPSLSGKLAFSLAQGTSHKVYVVEVGDQAPGDLYASVGNARQPALSHDGEWLLVNGTGGGLDAIAKMSSNGHNVQAITCPAITGESGRPVWSPDDTRIAFDGLNADPTIPQIYIQLANEVDCDLTTDKLLIGGGFVTDPNGLYPLWGPDNRIYFRGCETWNPQGASNCGIWSVEPDGSDVLQLLDDPNYLPTAVGRDRLLMMGAQSGQWEIYSVPITGGQPFNLTNQPTTEVWGTLSPDGKTLAYLSNRDGRWAIWLADADGGNPRAWLPISQDWGEVDPDQIADERMSWSE
jgi:TolB protein